MRFDKLFRALICVSAVVLGGHAHAQATRTWVSGVGDDANPCSRTAPCKTFAGAISKTATGGVINTLDPGGYGAVTITKAITIENEGAGEAGVLVAGTNGIIVNAPTGSSVILRGLQLDGVGTGLSGIKVLSGDVFVENCVIRGFKGNPGVGINLEASAKSRLFVSRSTIVGNLIGVQSNPSASTGTVIKDTVIERNQQYGVRGVGQYAILSLNGTAILGTAVGVSAPAPAMVYSYGNNAISAVEPGTTLTPMALQ
ncbi:MAG: hypothetical protein ACOZJX_10050 [Pseudomonadota bacterium]